MRAVDHFRVVEKTGSTAHGSTEARWRGLKFVLTMTVFSSNTCSDVVLVHIQIVPLAGNKKSIDSRVSQPLKLLIFDIRFHSRVNMVDGTR